MPLTFGTGAVILYEVFVRVGLAVIGDAGARVLLLQTLVVSITSWREQAVQHVLVHWWQQAVQHVLVHWWQQAVQHVLGHWWRQAPQQWFL